MKMKKKKQTNKQKQKQKQKTPGDIIILHMYTKNYDHMMYCSWHMLHEGQTNG